MGGVEPGDDFPEETSPDVFEDGGGDDRDEGSAARLLDAEADGAQVVFSGGSQVAAPGVGLALVDKESAERAEVVFVAHGGFIVGGVGNLVVVSEAFPQQAQRAGVALKEGFLFSRRQHVADLTFVNEGFAGLEEVGVGVGIGEELGGWDSLGLGMGGDGGQQQGDGKE